jgi:GNAT superfamily N-acetyltransferase
MQEQERDGIVVVTFQQISLPRAVEIAYPRQAKDLIAGWAGCELFAIERQNATTRGYVAARALPGNSLVWIQDIVVDRPWRRQGLGSQLLRQAAHWARRKGLRRLIVEVQTNNYPGIAFCKSQQLAFCGYHDWHWRTHDIALLFGQSLR